MANSHDHKERIRAFPVNLTPVHQLPVYAALASLSGVSRKTAARPERFPNEPSVTPTSGKLIHSCHLNGSPAAIRWSIDCRRNLRLLSDPDCTCGASWRVAREDLDASRGPSVPSGSGRRRHEHAAPPQEKRLRSVVAAIRTSGLALTRATNGLRPH